MNRVLSLLALALLCGCAAPQKRGQSQIDPFDAVRIEQMTANNVSGAPLQRTLLCLNARRETRRVLAVTNHVVTLVTNSVVSYTTNLYTASATNTVSTLSTNQLPLPPAAGIGSSTNEESSPRVIAQSPPEPATNSAVTRTADTTLSLTSGANQSVISLNTQSSVAFNNQSTTTHSNLAISAVASGLVRTESSQTVTAVTNYFVSAVTNQVILSTNLLLYDHYLYTELAAPSDFNLAPGDSLFLLVDGTRYAFAPTNSTAAPFGRPGFLCTLYKVPPELLVALANSQQARVRLRGSNTHIERDLSQACRRRFKEFLASYYTPQSVSPEWPLRSLDSQPAPAKRAKASST
jgi:hypothetical protein